jgi:hypothetical protein
VKDEVVEVSIEEPDTDVDDDEEDVRLDTFLHMSQFLQQISVLEIHVLLVRVMLRHLLLGMKTGASCSALGLSNLNCIWILSSLQPLPPICLIATR